MTTRRLSIFIACAVLCIVGGTVGIQEFSAFGPIAGHTVPAKTPPAFVRSLRPNYPYSVIPGGVYSAPELRYASKADQVVRAHYIDFDMSTVHMEELARARFQYASYRLKGRIYWTKKRLRIPKGELLITDGRHFARARCGNRLSDSPHNQTGLDEPPDALLAMPAVKLAQLADIELAPAPPAGDLAQRFPESLDVPPTLAPVLPTGPIPGALPFDMPPIAPVSPITSVAPGEFVLPLGSSTTPTRPLGIPAVIPPINTPPVIIAIPEPSTVYLFVVTFFASLYGLTRMMGSEDETETGASKN